MGAYKPLLPFGEETVIEACLNNFQRAAVDEIIIVVPSNQAERMRAQLSQRRVRFAVNEDATSEMSASIARGVEQLSNNTKALFIALADQPMIPPAVIRQLLDERARTNARIVAPKYREHGGHPVLLDYNFREELLDLDCGRGLRALFDAHKDEVHRVSVDTSFVARDMDTWDDYCALHTEIFGTPPPPRRER